MSDQHLQLSSSGHLKLHSSGHLKLKTNVVYSFGSSSDHMAYGLANHFVPKNSTDAAWYAAADAAVAAAFAAIAAGTPPSSYTDPTGVNRGIASCSGIEARTWESRYYGGWYLDAYALGEVVLQARVWPIIATGGTFDTPILSSLSASISGYPHGLVQLDIGTYSSDPGSNPLDYAGNLFSGSSAASLTNVSVLQYLSVRLKLTGVLSGGSPTEEIDATSSVSLGTLSED